MELVNLEQFSFSKELWAREGLMKTTGIITSKAKPSRSESSVQVGIPASAKGSSRAATYSREKPGTEFSVVSLEGERIR